MLLALTDAPASGERAQQRFVDAPVERGKLQPRLQMRKDLVVGDLSDEMLQHRGVTAAQAAALRHEPAVEHRAAIDLESFEKVADKQRGQGSQPLGGQRLDALLDRLVDLDRIDDAVREVEPDGVGLGLDPAAAGLIDDAPDLAEAPAQLAARIVGNVPQQFAKLAARHGVRRQRQIAEQRAHLA